MLLRSRQRFEGAGRPPEDDDDAEEPRGKLLELVNVTIAEPKHQTHRGDRWRLGDRHTLLVASVMEDWAAWAPLLTGDALFCPYPGPFIAFGEGAEAHSLVMVQPDLYTAGHILDRYAEVHGARSVRKVAA